MPVINPKTGKEFDWINHPPSGKTRARWHRKTIYGKPVYGSVRHIAHLDRLNNVAKARFGRGIEIIQPAYNTGVAASAGTHDYDMTVDLYIPGVSWWTQQRFFRHNGLGCWYRHRPQFGNHIHGFTLPPHSPRKDRAGDFKRHGLKVGKYVDGGISLFGYKRYSAQIDDYFNEAFGLANQHRKGSDKSWFPKNKQATIFSLAAYVRRRRAVQAKRLAAK